MKIKHENRRHNFNVYLTQEDRDVIDELQTNNINVSGVFKTFTRKYLEKIKQTNHDIYQDV